MSVAQFVDFNRTKRGDSSQPGGWRGGRNLRYPSARGQAAKIRSYLRLIGPRINNISTNEAGKERSLKQGQKVKKNMKK